jgi:hypothetical protein
MGMLQVWHGSQLGMVWVCFRYGFDPHMSAKADTTTSTGMDWVHSQLGMVRVCCGYVSGMGLSPSHVRQGGHDNVHRYGLGICPFGYDTGMLQVWLWVCCGYDIQMGIIWVHFIGYAMGIYPFGYDMGMYQVWIRYNVWVWNGYTL